MSVIDLMHWCHVSITTTACWGSRLVALRARVVLAERIGAQPLNQCAGPGQPGGMARRGWPAGCMLGDGARGSATFDPQCAWAPFCDFICIRSIHSSFSLILKENCIFFAVFVSWTAPMQQIPVPNPSGLHKIINFNSTESRRPQIPQPTPPKPPGSPSRTTAPSKVRNYQH